jgi:tetraacyldisaccharide 4'-kinase
MSQPEILLKPLSWLYRSVVAARSVGYGIGFLPQAKLPGKVLSIGNLAAGGTGKSPVVAALATFLQKRGLSPAILTRGYGSGLASGESLALLGEQVIMSAGRVVALPDEARMQAVALANVPVIAGADRTRAARRFLQEKAELTPTHWLLDDGFQHRQIARDVDIVLLDARRPFGGFLREGPRALRRADLVLCTRASDNLPTAGDLAAIEAYGEAPVLVVPFASSRPTTSVRGSETFDSARHSPAFLATAIAQPTRLIADVQKKLQIPLGGTLVAQDHAALPKSALVAALGDAKCVLTTAKDYWRDPAVFADLPVPVFVLPLTVEWNEEALAKAISAGI